MVFSVEELIQSCLSFEIPHVHTHQVKGRFMKRQLFHLHMTEHDGICAHDWTWLASSFEMFLAIMRKTATSQFLNNRHRNCPRAVLCVGYGYCSFWLAFCCGSDFTILASPWLRERLKQPLYTSISHMVSTNCLALHIPSSLTVLAGVHGSCSPNNIRRASDWECCSRHTFNCWNN